MSPSAKARLASHLAGVMPADMNIISDRAGIPRRLGARARVGRQINATSHLLLCSAVGLDVDTGAEVEGVSRAGSVVVWWIFGSALFLTRHSRRLDLRSASALIGVSTATLSRAEVGEPVGIDSFIRIARFIGLPPPSFLCFTENTNCNTLENKGADRSPESEASEPGSAR
jgi:hypothetical protein